MSERELQDKVALITGVGRRVGIGAAIARELASAGAKVFVTYFGAYDQRQTWSVEPGEPEALIGELSKVSDVRGIELDLSDPSAPARLFERALADFGRVDILVNNAAHWEAGGLDRVDAAQLDRHFAVNTRAAILLCAEFARRLEPGRPGRIVNITSGQGRTPMPGELAYVISKAPLDALSLTLSVELAARGITVNAIDPGPTDTGWMSSEQERDIRRASPTGKIARPTDTARLVRLLVRADAASVTGQILRVHPA